MSIAKLKLMDVCAEGHRLKRACLLSVLGMVSGMAVAADIQVYNPYLTPPFVNGSGGLASDVVAYLNRLPGKPYRFVLQTMPKARVLALIRGQGAQFADVVLFQMPAFMGDPQQQAFFWSRPLFADNNLLVFPRKNAPVLDSLAGLHGLVFGGVRGHHYRSLDLLVQEGLLHREDANDEEGNLRKLQLGRIGFTQLSQSVYGHYSRLPDLTDSFVTYAAFEPPVWRQLAVGKGNPALFRWLEKKQAGMVRDKAWRALLARYQLTPFVATADRGNTPSRSPD